MRQFLFKHFGLVRPAQRDLNLVHEHAALGDRERDGGNWAEALGHYKRAVKVQPHLEPIWVQYGHSLKETGQLAEAELAYRRALEIKGDNADTYLQLGHILKLQQDRVGMVRAYLKAGELAPDLESVRLELSRIPELSEPEMDLILTDDRGERVSANARHETKALYIFDLSGFAMTGPDAALIKRLTATIIRLFSLESLAQAAWKFAYCGDGQTAWVQLDAASGEAGDLLNYETLKGATFVVLGPGSRLALGRFLQLARLRQTHEIKVVTHFLDFDALAHPEVASITARQAARSFANFACSVADVASAESEIAAASLTQVIDLAVTQVRPLTLLCLPDTSNPSEVDRVRTAIVGTFVDPHAHRLFNEKLVGPTMPHCDFFETAEAFSQSSAAATYGKLVFLRADTQSILQVGTALDCGTVVATIRDPGFSAFASRLSSWLSAEDPEQFVAEVLRFISIRVSPLRNDSAASMQIAAAELRDLPRKSSGRSRSTALRPLVPKLLSLSEAMRPASGLLDGSVAVCSQYCWSGEDGIQIGAEETILSVSLFLGSGSRQRIAFLIEADEACDIVIDEMSLPTEGKVQHVASGELRWYFKDVTISKRLSAVQFRLFARPLAATAEPVARCYCLVAFPSETPGAWAQFLDDIANHRNKRINQLIQRSISRRIFARVA